MTKFGIGLLAGVIAIGLAVEARAAEIKLLTAGAMRSVVGALTPAFESKTGHS